MCRRAGLTPGFSRTMLDGFVRTDLTDSRGVQVSPFLDNFTEVLRGDSSSLSDQQLTSLGQCKSPSSLEMSEILETEG